MIRKKYDENFFEVIDTEEKAYFLGFIMADGCVINNKEKYRYLLTIKIHPKDKEILEKFIEVIKGEMVVTMDKKREICQIHISGKKIVSDLERLGCVENKTKTLVYPNLPKELERHFLRGYFDGDGCVRVKEDKRDNTKRGDVRIIGASYGFITKYNNAILDIFGVTTNKPYGPKTNEYYFIGWASMTDVEKIYKGFYDKTELFLTRKKTIFNEVVEIIRNKQKYRKK